MRTSFDKTTVSLAWAGGKYLTVIMPNALCLYTHPASEMWCSNNRTPEFILTWAKGNKGKMHIPNQKAVGMRMFPCVYNQKKKKKTEAAAVFSWHNLMISVSELYPSLLRNVWNP